MQRRRSFIESLDGNDDESLPASKRQKIQAQQPVMEYDARADEAMITMPCSWNVFSPLHYRPFWICGYSTAVTFGPSDIEEYSPSAFLMECQYPFLRVCDIPKATLITLSSSQNNTYDYLSDYKIYKYDHALVLKHQIKHNTQFSEYINVQLNEFHCKHMDRNKALDCLDHRKSNPLAHLFIMKEYYKSFSNRFQHLLSAQNNKCILSTDIIQYTLNDYIFEIQTAKDIQFLNDNKQINQIKWFEFSFYFLEFMSKKWQIFFYQIFLEHSNEYQQLIINFMKRKKKLAFRHLECTKLMEYCLSCYPKTGNKFNPSSITGFINYSIELRDRNFFEISMKLLDSIKPNVFWGTLLFQIIKNIEFDSLSFFNQICVKMKEHCDGKEKVIEKSLNKFNQRTVENIGLKVANWDEDQLKCVEMMQNTLNYDINSIVPFCVKKYNIGFLQYLIENDILDYDICCNDGYLDEISKLVAFGNRKRNKREGNSEFENAFNHFVSKHSTKK